MKKLTLVALVIAIGAGIVVGGQMLWRKAQYGMEVVSDYEALDLAATTVILYFKANSQWPSDLQALRSTFRYPNGKPRDGARWTNLISRVEFAFDIDPIALLTDEPAIDASVPPYRFLWLRDETDHPFLAGEANAMILRHVIRLHAEQSAASDVAGSAAEQ